MNNRIYLDYNATAPMCPEVIETVNKITDMPYNASSVHSFGREARKIIENARINVAALAGATPNQVIFNSGATEGNNTVLTHFKDEHILVSSIEHPSVLKAQSNAETIPVTKEGTIDLNALEDQLKQKNTTLVSLMLVNNETGIIQPVQEAAALAKKHGSLVHCDAVQAAGKMSLNLTEIGVDFLTLSAHKLGGPQGVGALVLGICGITPTLLTGGGQEKSARAGTENISGIAGFGAISEVALNKIDTYRSLSKLQEKLETALLKSSDHLIIHGQSADRVPNTTLFSLPGIPSETMLMAFDLENIAISNGSACSSGRVEPSHVLTAMGYDNNHASSALRISTGWNTKPSDIDAFLDAWHKILPRFKDKVTANA